MIKTLRNSVTGLVLAIATSACVTVPEQPQIASQSNDGGISTLSASCKSSVSAQRISQPTDSTLQALDPGGFSVLNWNIYKGNRSDWQQDLLRLSNQQDIVLLQEALLTDALKSSLDKRGLKWNLNTAFYYDNRHTGVMTAARVGSSYHCALRTIEPIIRTPKTALISRYDLAGVPEQLMVANIHGINFTFGLDAYREQLDNLEEILAQHDGPILLAGDFNNWSNGRTRLLTEMVQRLSLQQLPYENHNRTMVFGSAIDHIFYRGLTVVTHETHQVTSSDHNPITVVFRATPTRIARNP
jgi:endonuclease/exonuclease/phosphatase (EEP) superfamily protein YafD